MLWIRQCRFDKDGGVVYDLETKEEVDFVEMLDNNRQDNDMIKAAVTGVNTYIIV